MLVRAWEPVNTGERLQDLIVLPVKSAGLQNMFVFSALSNFSTYSILLHKLFADDLREEGVHGVSRIVGPPASSLLWCRGTQTWGLQDGRTVLPSSTKAVVNEEAGRSKLPGNAGFFWFLKSWFDQTFDDLSIDQWRCHLTTIKCRGLRLAFPVNVLSRPPRYLQRMCPSPRADLRQNASIQCF